MSKFLSGRKLLERLGIKDFEIVEAIHNGQVPYDSNGLEAFATLSKKFWLRYFEMAHYAEKVSLEGTLPLPQGRAAREDLIAVVNLDLAITRETLENISKNGIRGLSLPKGGPISGVMARYMIDMFIECYYRIGDSPQRSHVSVDPKTMPNESRTKKSREQEEFLPCPDGTTWKQIEMTLVDNDTVRVKAPHGQTNLNYSELGMRDKRKTDSPILAWALLQKCFAPGGGRVSPHDMERPMSNLVKAAESLNRHLREAFGIQDSIFEAHYRRNHEYKLKFTIRDRTFK